MGSAGINPRARIRKARGARLQTHAMRLGTERSPRKKTTTAAPCGLHTRKSQAPEGCCTSSVPCSAVLTLLQKVGVLPEHAEMPREREREGSAAEPLAIHPRGPYLPRDGSTILGLEGGKSTGRATRALQPPWSGPFSAWGKDAPLPRSVGSAGTSPG